MHLVASGSAVISIRMLPLCQMLSATWYGLFSPPAFQDNYFNVDPELHFAFFKHGGNLWLAVIELGCVYMRDGGTRVGRDKGPGFYPVTAQRDVMCDGSMRILGAGRIRQCSGKSKVELTSGRTWRCDFWWRCKMETDGWEERMAVSGEDLHLSEEKEQCILFPATTSLEAILFIWLSCSCSGQVEVFPSVMLRCKEYLSLNSAYMTGKKNLLMLQVNLFVLYLFLTRFHFSFSRFQFCHFNFPLPLAVL